MIPKLEDGVEKFEFHAVEDIFWVLLKFAGGFEDEPVNDNEKSKPSGWDCVG